MAQANDDGCAVQRESDRAARALYLELKGVTPAQAPGAKACWRLAKAIALCRDLPLAAANVYQGLASYADTVTMMTCPLTDAQLGIACYLNGSEETARLAAHRLEFEDLLISSVELPDGARVYHVYLPDVAGDGTATCFMAQAHEVARWRGYQAPIANVYMVLAKYIDPASLRRQRYNGHGVLKHSMVTCELAIASLAAESFHPEDAVRASLKQLEAEGLIVSWPEPGASANFYHVNIPLPDVLSDAGPRP